MSTSTYYNFMVHGPAKRALEPPSSHRITRQSSDFPNPFSTSVSCLNQASSPTPVSSASSSSSDSAVSSFTTNNDACSLVADSHQPLAIQTSPRQPRLRRQSALVLGTNQTTPLCHSYSLLPSLEPKSFRPFKSNSEYLEAMKEDLAEWLNKLYPDLRLNTDNFFSELETGAIICRHANNVTNKGRDLIVEQQAQHLSALTVDLNNSNSSGACSRSSNSSSSGSFVNQHYPNKHETHKNDQFNLNDTVIELEHSDNIQSSLDCDRDKLLLHCSPLLNTSISEPPDSALTSNSSILMDSSNSSFSDGSARGYDSVSPNTIVTGSDNELINRVSNQDLEKHTTFRQQQPTSQQPPSFISTSSQCSFLGSSSNFRSIPSCDLQNPLQNRQHNNINWFKIRTINYKPDAFPGTFFARDNICQFILWCRSLNIIDCLLFETDDLVDRKNEKSFILCLLEVARIGFKVGMPTPLIIQLEQEIDREIENDAKLLCKLKVKQDKSFYHECNHGCYCDDEIAPTSELSVLEDQESKKESSIKLDEQNDKKDDSCKSRNEENDTELEDSLKKEVEEEKEDETGPKPQVITNDLLSLHERVVQLLCQCTCPTQFPMVQVGDNGKYKVGDKLIIFVRILRRHIMVRVGGGWQELSEFLRVKDPCRSKLYSQSQNFQHSHQHHLQNFGNIQTTSIKAAPNTMPALKSRLPGLINNHLSGFNRFNNGHQYRSANGQRLISSSASMGWLSNNA